MIMKLSQKQQYFTKCVGLLIQYATMRGYGLTLGDAYRDPRVHGEVGEKKSYSATNSLHKSRLAIDFNLFINGEYIVDSEHVAFKDLGEYWKSLDPFCRWGGDFKVKDANHFSFTHNGVA